MPFVPINTPAIAGPITRAALNSDEFSAIAFIRSSLPTISTMNDCRMGMSNALAMPRIVARTRTCQTAITPVHTRIETVNASSMNATCIRMMTRRLSVRSAITPAYRLNSSTPTELSAAVRPT